MAANPAMNYPRAILAATVAIALRKTGIFEPRPRCKSAGAQRLAA
jgi:hypothetical protein